MDKFLFVVCQVGAEPALKKELTREHPAFRFAYSRPGFVTFKWAPDLDKRPGKTPAFDSNFELCSIFARAYGVSVGKVTTVDEVIRAVREFSLPELPLQIHVWEREQFAPGEEPPKFVPGQWLGSFLEQLSRSVTQPINQPAVMGDRVLDVMILEEGQYWIGYHDHGPAHSPYPGGRPPVVLPAEAPSRAYLKLEEALLWSGADFAPGMMAVEVGSSPGGASYALLKRGVRVVGIDPAEMDPDVLKMPGFQHLRMGVAVVHRSDLPDRVDWLLSDMNVPPGVVMTEIEPLVKMLSSTLKGMILTIKLNHWRMADDIPAILHRIRKMGMARVRATQLASNRREICVFALASRGERKF